MKTNLALEPLEAGNVWLKAKADIADTTLGIKGHVYIQRGQVFQGEPAQTNGEYRAWLQDGNFIRVYETEVTRATSADLLKAATA